jgi:hypothetical protein
MSSSTAGFYDGEGATSRHAYPAAAMAGDYLRAAVGLVPALILVATVPIGSVAAVVLGGFAAIFALFGVRTALRHATRIELTPTGLRASGALRGTIAWSQLDRLRLAYYSTRRDRKSGWMQLQLGAGGARVALDSRIDGFEHIVERAAAAAAARDLALSDATLVNLDALGVRLSALERPSSGAAR